VLIPLPQQELFDYLVEELVTEFEGIIEDDILRVVGSLGKSGPEVSIGATEEEPAVVMYVTTAARRLTLDVPVPSKQEGKRVIQNWVSEYDT
jgi:hypothetical protein